jgi:hypothetical protein
MVIFFSSTLLSCTMGASGASATPGKVLMASLDALHGLYPTVFRARVRNSNGVSLLKPDAVAEIPRTTSMYGEIACADPLLNVRHCELERALLY